jgi:DnaJ-class molecular chaperone
MLKVPQLTQNGRLIRLTGLGMPHMEGSGKGDLYARVKIVLPDKLSDRERELFEELRSLQQEKVTT